MTTVRITNYNFWDIDTSTYVANTWSNIYYIEILATKISKTIGKKATPIPIPRAMTVAEWGGGSEKDFIDLVLTDKTLTVTGFITKESKKDYNAGDRLTGTWDDNTAADVNVVEDNILEMIDNGGTI